MSVYFSIHLVVGPIAFVRRSIRPRESALPVEHVCPIFTFVFSPVHEVLVTHPFLLIISKQAIKPITMLVYQDASPVDQIIHPSACNNIPRDMIKFTFSMCFVIFPISLTLRRALTLYRLPSGQICTPYPSRFPSTSSPWKVDPSWYFVDCTTDAI